MPQKDRDNHCEEICCRLEDSRASGRRGKNALTHALNILDFARKCAKLGRGMRTIANRDIFHYVYAVLYHPHDSAEKFAGESPRSVQDDGVENLKGARCVRRTVWRRLRVAFS